MKLLKNQELWLGVAVVLLSLGMFIFIVPFLIPISVPKDIRNHFSYTVYGDHVELTKYHETEDVVKVPSYLWGRPVTVIGYHCFHVNLAINQVILPDTVEEIHLDAFSHCYSLEEIIGGENVKIIENDAFSACKELKSVDLGPSVEEIGWWAFNGCNSLQSFEISDNLKSIGEAVFCGTKIEHFEEKENVKIIGANAFRSTPWYEAQTDEYVFYNDILIKYNGTEEVVKIPEGTTGIAMYFPENAHIREIYVPTTVEYITGQAFGDLENVRIYIPDIEVKTDMGSTDNPIGLLEEVTIVTVSGSPAEVYAKEMGYKCEIVEPWW